MTQKFNWVNPKEGIKPIQKKPNNTIRRLLVLGDKKLTVVGQTELVRNLRSLLMNDTFKK